MQAGRMNQRIVLQTQTAGVDAIGQPVSTWANTATLWAHIRYMGGLEAIKAGALTSSTQASVRIRYRTGITTGQRLLHGLTYYNITAVMPHEREWLDLVCEVVA